LASQQYQPSSISARASVDCRNKWRGATRRTLHYANLATQHNVVSNVGECAVHENYIGVGERVLESAKPGVLYNDFSACAAYRGGLTSATRVVAPTLLICGEKDQMTPLKSGRSLGSTIPGATIVTLTGAGHMLMAERPREVPAAVAKHLALAPRGTAIP
jgi:pimeloyl-ACP methyl ester carboxylesterase